MLEQRAINLLCHDDALRLELEQRLRQLGYPTSAHLATAAFATIVHVTSSFDIRTINDLDGGGSCVLAMMDSRNAAALDDAIAAGARGIVELPLRAINLRAQIALARSAHDHSRRLSAKSAHLERTLRHRKDIEIAIGLLADQLGVTAEAAYAHLRSQAMEQRLYVGEVAKSLAQQHALRPEP